MTTITTNHHYRDIVPAYALTSRDLRSLGVSKEEYQIALSDPDGDSFFDKLGYLEGGVIRYRGETYPLSEFVRIVPNGGSGGGFAHYDHEGALKGWDGIHTDSFFSAVVVAFDPEDEDRVRVGLLLS
jgi:hypothetical protein